MKKNVINPKIIELLLTNKYFLNKYYWLATGQGRTRLQINDFLNIKIPKKILKISKEKSKKYLEYLNKISELEKNKNDEKIKINNLFSESLNEIQKTQN